jgi:methionyl-tRNA formyltransferase
MANERILHTTANIAKTYRQQLTQASKQTVTVIQAVAKSLCRLCWNSGATVYGNTMYAIIPKPPTFFKAFNNTAFKAFKITRSYIY